VNLFQQGFTSATGPKRSWFLHHSSGGFLRFPTSHAGIPIAGWFHGKSPKINGWFLEKWWMDVNGEHHTEHQTHRIMMIISLILKNSGSSNYLATLVTPGLASNLLMVGFLKPYWW
jgi:hypothetical protein